MQESSRAPTTEQPPGRELANDPLGNACFGCGPGNPEGLHLRFFDDGEIVRTPFDLDERFAAWEGFANMGIVLTAMLETGAWALWERVGPSRMDGAMTVLPVTPGIVGALMIEARIVLDGGMARVDVVALQNGKDVMRATWGARRATPDEAKAFLSMPNIPRSLRGAIEDRAAERE